ncbi:MAG: hypothetical protein ACYCOU_07950 [Sulfobacillus sp.]
MKWCLVPPPDLAACSPAAAMTMAASSHPESAAASEPGTAPPPRLLDVMRARMRRLGLSLSTMEAYVGWGRRFAAFVCDAVVVSGFPSPTPAFGDDVLAREWWPVCAVLARGAGGVRSPLDRAG